MDDSFFKDQKCSKKHSIYFKSEMLLCGLMENLMVIFTPSSSKILIVNEKGCASLFEFPN